MTCLKLSLLDLAAASDVIISTIDTLKKLDIMRHGITLAIISQMWPNRMTEIEERRHQKRPQKQVKDKALENGITSVYKLLLPLSSDFPIL